MNLQRTPDPGPSSQMAMHAIPVGDALAGPGRSQLLRVRSGAGARSLEAWVHVPANVNPDSHPLVAIHGISRCAKEQVQLLANAADRAGRIVIAPLFGRRHWRIYQRISNKNRADLALLDLLGRIELQGIARLRKFDLAGYSGGAQLAHRFAMLFPQRIGTLSIIAAGWYCMPDADTPYPYGLAARPGRKADWGPRMMAGLDVFLRLPINIMVGASDTATDPTLRRSSELDAKQGTNRLERAKAYHAALTGLARQRAIPSQISFSLLQGSSHSFSQCVKKGGLDRLILE